MEILPCEFHWGICSNFISVLLCKTLLLQLISYLCGHLFYLQTWNQTLRWHKWIQLAFLPLEDQAQKQSIKINSQLVGGSQPFAVIFLLHTVLWSNCFFRHLCFRDISFFLRTTQIAPGRVSCHDSLLLRLLLPPLPNNKRNRGLKQTGGKKKRLIIAQTPFLSLRWKRM